MNEQKNLVVAILLVVGILFGFHYFYEQPKLQEQQRLAEIAKEHAAKAPSTAAHTPSTAQNIGTQASAITPFQNRNDALNTSQRITIQTPTLEGSINLKGGVIDDLRLKNYKETADENSKPIILLSPKTTKEGYLGATHWRHVKTEDAAHFALPNADDVWIAEGGDAAILTHEKPIILSYSNGKGQIFRRKITLDDKYMFTIEDSIDNKSDHALNIIHSAMIERHDIPVSAQSGFILHEGAIGVINGKLHEVDYSDMSMHPKPSKESFHDTKRSWIGFTDKYWLTALIPTPQQPSSMTFMGDDGKKEYYTLAESAAIGVPVGGQHTHTVHFFAGAKELDLLDHYEATIGFDKFDLAVDFGWFYFLTKPMLGFLQYLHTFLGNFGLGILALTVLMKVLFFPLANKSYRSMSRMRAFAPHIEALKAKYGDDRMKLNQAMMDLYKKHKINPVSGCLPMIIQAPVFFCLYKVLYVSLDMRHAPFYGWIHDLSAPDPTTLFNLFGMLSFTPPSFLHIGAWPILMGITMWLQQKLNPQPADKAQATMFMIMPLFMTFLFASFPAGLVIYWAWSNILGIIQQATIMKIEARRMASSS